jgi:hypothetical protein
MLYLINQNCIELIFFLINFSLLFRNSKRSFHQQALKNMKLIHLFVAIFLQVT